MSNFSGIQKGGPQFRPAMVNHTDPHCHKVNFVDGGSAELGVYGVNFDGLRSASNGTVLKAAADSGLSVFFKFVRKDEQRREVHGVIADETPDKSNETFDYETSKPHFQQWANEAVERTVAAGQPISYGNVRAQHSNVAAGKLTDVAFDDKGKKISVIAKVVDDDAWRKVQEGVYTGFSIGGKYLKKWGDGSNVRYTAKPMEVSLVDSPCNPSATFTAIKSAPSETSVSDALRELRELAKQVDEMLARRSDPNQGGSRFIPRDSYDPNLVAADAVTRVPRTAGAGEEVHKDDVNQNQPHSRFRPLQTGEVWTREDVRKSEDTAQNELHKALANGKPVRYSHDNAFQKD